ncbi:MAG: hypothetical protein ACR2PG_05715 [Hyphomicrobiaceae bacterium]
MKFRWELVVVFLAFLVATTLSVTGNVNTVVFLKAFYPLDEPRFHCVDVPGHKERVNTRRPLAVHTCKEGIWHGDELFDIAALKNGLLRMPQFDICVTASTTENAAELFLKPCVRSDLQVWQYSNYRLRLVAYPDKCLTIGIEPSRLTPGGKRLASRHVARSLQLDPCSQLAFQRQLWRFEAPQQRSGPIMPFVDSLLGQRDAR